MSESKNSAEPPPTKPPRSRARKPPAAGKGRKGTKGSRAMKDNKPERVRHIMRLMGEKRWVPGITGPELAKRWGCSDTVLANDAAEASRRIHDGVMLDEELRDLVVMQLTDVQRNTEEILRKCVKSKQFRTAVEALNTHVKTIQVLAGIRGIEGPKKIEIGGCDIAGLLDLANSKADSDNRSG